MQMECDGVAGIADESENLATFNFVVRVDPDGAGLHVCVKRMVPVAKLEDDVVAVGGVE